MTSIFSFSGRMLLPFAYMLGLFLLSSIHGDSHESSSGMLLAVVPPTLQNFLHIPVFGGLAYCWFWALARDKPINQALLIAAIVSVCYSVIDELYQTTVPGRFGSFTDLLLDVTGIAIAVLWIKFTHANGKPQYH